VIGMATLGILGGCGGASSAATRTLGISAPAGWSTQLVADPDIDVYFALPPGWTLGQTFAKNSDVERLLVPDGSPGTIGPNGVPRAGTLRLVPSIGLVDFTPHPSGPLLSAYRERAAFIHRAHTSDYHATLAPASVPGATQAELINDSFRTAGKTETDSELLMRTRAGAQIEVIAETITGAAHPLYPRGVTESVRLKAVKSL
jgi:hypothetical protein